MDKCMMLKDVLVVDVRGGGGSLLTDGQVQKAVANPHFKAHLFQDMRPSATGRSVCLPLEPGTVFQRLFSRPNRWRSSAGG